MKECQYNIICKIQYCDKWHHRYFSGICILGVQNNQQTGECNDNSCKLYHFSQRKFKTEMQIYPINGIFRYNICKFQRCEQSESCQFLHPEWAENLCITHLMDDCDDQFHKNHVNWRELRQIVYQKYEKILKFKQNPENQLEQLEYHFQIHNICSLNFRGLCEKKTSLCTKFHLFWEEFHKKNFINKQSLKSCIELNDSRQFNSFDLIPTKSLLLNEDELKKLQQKVKRENNVDLIFIMNFALSMQPWIEQCLGQIKKIIGTFRKKFPRYSLRIGFVGYRECQDKERLFSFDLTNEYEKLIAFIAKQQLKGNGSANDLFSALKKAMELNLSKSRNSILITILFADLPCHGKQYHNLANDELADQIQEGTLENLMKQYYEVKEINCFTCVGITHKTEIMYKIMQQNFPELLISKFSSPIQFEKLVEFTLIQSVNITIRKQSQSFRAYFQKPKYYNYNFQDNNYKKKFWEEFENRVQLKKGETILEIDYNNMEILNYDESSSLLKFQSFDVINNQFVIIYVVSQNYNVSQQTNISQQCLNFPETAFYDQVKARQMAYIFRQRTYECKEAPPLFFTLPILYDLVDQSIFGFQQLYAEVDVFLPDTQFELYQSDGWILNQENYEYLSAFTHFVYQESQNQFIIGDLQGQRNILSLASIQSLRKNIEHSKKVDIINFLLQHDNCSNTCIFLQLESLNKKQQMSDSRWENVRLDGKIDIICEQCDSVSETLELEYQKRKVHTCNQCLKRQNKIVDQVCQCCKEIFKNYNEEQKIKSCLYTCDYCTQNCYSEKRNQKACYYCKITCRKLLNTSIILQDQQIQICQKGKLYLMNFNCQICKKNYDFSEIIEKRIYINNGLYSCEDCRSKQNN